MASFSRTTWVCQYEKRETSLDSNEARDDEVLGWQWHQLDHMQTIYTSLQTDNNINNPSLNFYRLDVLPDTQITVSKHCGQFEGQHVVITIFFYSNISIS